jgi:hypothetical protein
MNPSREELLAATFNKKLAKQGEKSRKLAESRDVNTMPDPKTYAAVMGLLGTRPDEMGFSVAHPQYKEIMDVAVPAFYAGTAAQVAPVFKPLAPAAKATAKMAGQALNDRLLAGQSLTPGFNTPSPINFVVKPEGGNWLGGNLMGNVDRSIDRLTPTNDLNAHINVLKAQLASAENRAGSAREIQNLKDDIADAQKDQAVNNWVKSNLGKYAKNQMATPSDPVRLMFEKRTQNVEAELARANERVARMRERAAAEPDERRRANLMNNAAQAEIKAQNDYQLALENVMHTGITPDLSAKDLAMERVAAGFQPQGMGQSRAAKNWEGAADESIRAYNAGAIQNALNIMPEVQNAERALLDYEAVLQKKFNDLIDSSTSFTDKQKAALNRRSMSDKAAILSDPEYDRLLNDFNQKKIMASGPEWHYGQQNKWVEKLDPNTTLYSGDISDLGFGHVIDILRHDVREGRIRPDQLNKVTVEQAVQRAADYNLAQAKKNTDVNLKMSEGFPVHKEYPEGYRWIELTKPEKGEHLLTDLDRRIIQQRQEGNPVPQELMDKTLDQRAMQKLEEALKYEGDVMGHCVGTYCPDVASGRSRIYSLRDPSGAPRVTIEVQPNMGGMSPSEFYHSREIPPSLLEKINQAEASGALDDIGSLDDFVMASPEYQTYLKTANPPRIVQIKGSGKKDPSQRLRHEGTGYADNPDAHLLPYVHDFVKSGQWSDVGDLRNAGLHRIEEGSSIPGFEEWMRLKAHGNVPTIPPGYYTPQELLQFGEQSGLKEIHPGVHNVWMKKLGLNPEEGMKEGGEVKATPVKNKPAHGMSKALHAVHEFASKPFGYNNPPGEMISDFLGIPATARTLERIGYGEPLTTGKGMTTKPKDDTLDALMAVAPLVPITKGMPIGLTIKPKGGNWFGKNVENELKSLKKYDSPTAEEKAWIAEHKANWEKNPNSEARDRALRAIENDMAVNARNEAINNWVDRNLTNYVKKEMATPEDPVRKLAEEGITHFPIAGEQSYWIRHGKRARENFGGEVMAKSPLAQQWENLTDSMIMRDTAQKHQDMMNLAPGTYSDQDEWVKKLAPDTPLYSAQQNRFDSLDLGFDHIIDVLREDVAAGRIRPEQLSKVSMEQAVRRTFEYDQEMAKKMREAQIKVTEGMPVHKEYPEGYKWIELSMPKAKVPEGSTWEEYNGMHRLFGPNGESLSLGATKEEAIRILNREERMKQLEDALTYEGNTMGHCVGGYCPDVMEGRSRIYSLRDAKGEPHVTVEVEPKTRGTKERTDWFAKQPENVQNKITAEALELEKTFPDALTSWHKAYKNIVDKYMGEELPRIAQIKGKQNREPNEKYLPYVQDFVQGGNWSHVDDLENAGLIDTHNLPDEYRRRPGIYDYLDYHATGRYHPIDDLDSFDDGYKKGGVVKMGVGGLLGKGARAMKGVESAQLKALREEFAARDAVIKAQQAVDEKKYLKDIEANTLTPESIQKKLDEQKPQGLYKGGEVKAAGGGLINKLSKLVRAPAKTPMEIEMFAERMAPQVLGQYVRESEKSAKTVAGKTKKQFEREKDLPVDIRANKGERKVEPLDIEKLKDNVVIGIPGDPTVTGKSLHGVGDVTLESAAPQHGGPLYGLYHDDDHFWASGLGAARRVQNLAREAEQQYGIPVLGKYIMMGPESINYAQHFADANLQAIDLSRMTKAQIEQFNRLMRQGSPASGPRPSFPGIEDKDSAYLQMAIDPEMRKHFNALMQQPTVTEPLNMPSGTDIRFAITEPELRNLETGASGFSMGRMRPDIPSEGLKLSEHPTYSHDIPGNFMGGTKYPMPYELAFPDTVKSVRENPKQAAHEFGSVKMVGPRQVIDQQFIDEMKKYEEHMKKLTGKKKGGAVQTKSGLLKVKRKK